MRPTSSNPILTILLSIAFLALGANAFAQGGMPWGHRGWGHHGPGGHHMGGPGMMNRGSGRGLDPGWMSQGDSPQYPQSRGPLEENDARAIVNNYLDSMHNPNLELGQIKDAGDAFEAEIVTKDKSLMEKVRIDKSSGWMRPAY
ncbi:MAG: hypothetical protein JSW39_23075 [Desulfobacterales bacterium]|nr:MAG: hypothetical protein JSW39_23075 [Desulfobacterales bacterium]